MTAYLLEPTSFDLSDLYHKPYGVQFIMDHKVSSKDFRKDDSELHEKVRRWAKGFDPYVDYFVLTGNLVKLVVAVLAIQSVYPNVPLKLLQYDNDSGQYMEVQYHEQSKATH